MGREGGVVVLRGHDGKAAYSRHDQAMRVCELRQRGCTDRLRIYPCQAGNEGPHWHLTHVPIRFWVAREAA